MGFLWHRIVVVPLLVAGLAACEEEQLEAPEIVRPLVVAKVGDVSTIQNEWFPGRAKATRTSELSFEVPGKVIERPVFVGDRVAEGQVLARLDARDYENELAAARAEQERARAQFERMSRAADKGAVAEQEVTNADAALRAAQAEVRIREKALDDTVLTAFFDGIVAYTYVERFEDVQAKQPVLRVVDTSRIEFVVNLPENAISYIPYVYDVRVQFDAFPGREFPANIKEVATEASETTRTYAVNLIMDQPKDATILPGMAGRATGSVDEEAIPQPDLLFIPVSAVFAPQGDETYVWIVDPDSKTVSRRPVKTGGLSNAGMVITEGLTAGELIAIAGVHFLEEGQRVEILEGSDLSS